MRQDIFTNKVPLPYDFEIKTLKTGGEKVELSDSGVNSSQPLNPDDPIEIFGLPLRLENYLKKGKIKTIGHLCEYPNEKFVSIKGVGGKTQEFFIQLKKQAKKRISIADSSYSGIKAKSKSIAPESMIDVLLSQCRDARSRDIVNKRYGLRNEEKHTLEEVGQLYDLTRERIRQIQAKTLKRMRSPLVTVRRPLTHLIERALFINDWLLTEEEADLQIPSALEEKHDDGSSVLDLVSDLGWIQSSKIGDIVMYSPLFDGVKLEKLSERINIVIKNEDLGIDLHSLVKKVSSFKRIKDKDFDPLKFTLRYCQVDPRIQTIRPKSDSPLFKHYSKSGNFTKQAWVTLMKRVLETEQMPLHFTEITNKVNDLLDNPDKRLDVRRAHSMLIETRIFAHTGIRGTYGLTAWGLRKESTPQLIEECITKAGFPLHWKQIYSYVSKYKDSRKASIISVLEVNPIFSKIGRGMYGLSENYKDGNDNRRS